MSARDTLISPKTLTTLSVQRMLATYDVSVEPGETSLESFWKLYEHLRRHDLNPWNRPSDSTSPSQVVIDGSPKVIFSSYSYLGLAQDERVLEAAEAAGRRYGVGAHGVRLLTGNLAIHQKLEARLAGLFGRDAALLFSSGYLCNIGVIPGLVDRSDIILVDQFAHASLMQGCQLSGARTYIFRHNSVEDAERQLRRAREVAGRNSRIFVVADSVFSMDGDIFDLPAFAPFCRREGLTLVLDEAHAFACIGPRGLGIEDHFNMPGAVHVLLGTLSKGIPACGGYVVADEKHIEFLRFGSAAPNTFSSPLSPYHCAAALRAIDLMIDEPQILLSLAANTRRMGEGLVSRGFDIGLSATPIIPVILGEEVATMRTWKSLFDAGFFTGAVTSPAVSLGRARLRVTAHAGHTEEQITQFIDCVSENYSRIAA